jgi:single-strand DNA-binding protein
MPFIPQLDKTRVPTTALWLHNYASAQASRSAIFRIVPLRRSWYLIFYPARHDTLRSSMASRSVNKVLLIGNLGRDAETKFTPSGVSVTRFSVATTRSWKDQQTNDWKEETNWTNVVLWRQENLANYLTKGKQVYVEGRLQTRSYDDKDGKKVYSTEVVADEVLLLGGRGESGGAEGAAGSQPAARSSAPPRGRPSGGGAPHSEDDFGGMQITDDDVPF